MKFERFASGTYGALTSVLVILGFLALLAFVIFSQNAVGAGAPTATPPSADTRTERLITLKGRTISVSVADTDATRQLGLGGRAGLATDEGMLFIFPQDGIYAFWMKDMRFSIDILWLSVDGQVVYMAQNVSPDTYPRDFVPARSARYVLELPAGYCATHTVHVGDRVTL